MFDEIEKLALMASLTEETCGLSHGPDPDKDAGKDVVDYISQPLGTDDGDGVMTVQDRLIVPVCRECAESLCGNDWVLLYCLGCNCSQWVIKKLSRRQYTNNILWMAECPECKE